MKRSTVHHDPVRGGRVALTALVLFAFLFAAAPAPAGERGECVSSKLANELMDCAHCNAIKKLLTHRAIGQVTMEIHELDRGAIVEIEAGNEAAVELVHELVGEIWNAEAHCETTLSEVCTARYHVLAKHDVERALTSHGALVVLRAESVEGARWILEDARNTRSFLLAAASR